MTSLEAAGRLNWWCGGKNSSSARVLWPLATTGDGNCLLHAASLGMWGFHDRLLTLRDALHNTLSKGEYKDALFRRWKWRQMGLNAAAGLAYTETEWLTEWQSIVEMASANPRSQTATSYQSLEEVCVYCQQCLWYLLQAISDNTEYCQWTFIIIIIIIIIVVGY